MTAFQISICCPRMGLGTKVPKSQMAAKHAKAKCARRWQSALISALFVMTTSKIMAKDLASLAEVVMPAYAAMNTGVVCNQYDPQFLVQTSGPRGTAVHYAEHVKNEAIISLSYVESSMVLKAAADEARQVARQKLHEFAVPGDDAATVRAIKLWCDSYGKPFILQFIEKHDYGHTQLIEFLQRAQQ